MFIVFDSINGNTMITVNVYKACTFVDLSTSTRLDVIETTIFAECKEVHETFNGYHSFSH